MYDSCPEPQRHFRGEVIEEAHPQLRIATGVADDVVSVGTGGLARQSFQRLDCWKRRLFHQARAELLGSSCVDIDICIILLRIKQLTLKVDDDELSGTVYRRGAPGSVGRIGGLRGKGAPGADNVRCAVGGAGDDAAGAREC